MRATTPVVARRRANDIRNDCLFSRTLMFSSSVVLMTEEEEEEGCSRSSLLYPEREATPQCFDDTSGSHYGDDLSIVLVV